MSMATKLRRVLIYDEEGKGKGPPIKLHDPLNSWTGEVTWKTLKTLYLHYQNTYDHQTSQYDNLSQVTPTQDQKRKI